MKLFHITDTAFTDHHWQSYYAMLESLRDRHNSPMARIGWEETKTRLLSLAANDANHHRFAVFDGSTAVGWADFTVFAKGTLGENASVRVEALDHPAPEEFERLIAAEFLRLLDDNQLDSAHLAANTERIAAIARHWCGDELNRVERFRLRRADARTELMTSWLAEVPRKNPNLRIEFFSPVPEAHLEAYTRLFVDYIREMPKERESSQPFEMSVEENRRDIEWRRKNKMHVYTFALFDARDMMIGHSNAVIVEDDPSDVYQAMTGINRDYRRKGLSRWLKAALFFKVGEDFPANESMTTVMRSANAPIQKVNAEMGYTLLSTGHEFDITVRGLREFLGR